MTQEEFNYEEFRLTWLKKLAEAYEAEHDWEEDEDPSATLEMLTEVKALAAELVAAHLLHRDKIEPPPAPQPDRPPLPF